MVKGLFNRQKHLFQIQRQNPCKIGWVSNVYRKALWVGQFQNDGPMWAEGLGWAWAYRIFIVKVHTKAWI